tara:strand:+ start:466 stop:573 length:108 start_codon:yes stop_codon:yes gene_type:complete
MLKEKLKNKHDASITHRLEFESVCLYGGNFETKVA